MSLPDGYTVYSWDEDKTKIFIGVYKFLLMFEDAEEFIYFDNKKYERGMLTIIPNKFAGRFCSCREYNLVE